MDTESCRCSVHLANSEQGRIAALRRTVELEMNLHDAKIELNQLRAEMQRIRDSGYFDYVSCVSENSREALGAIADVESIVESSLRPQMSLDQYVLSCIEQGGAAHSKSLAQSRKPVDTMLDLTANVAHRISVLRGWMTVVLPHQQNLNRTSHLSSDESRGCTRSDDSTSRPRQRGGNRGRGEQSASGPAAPRRPKASATPNKKASEGLPASVVGRQLRDKKAKSNGNSDPKQDRAAFKSKNMHHKNYSVLHSSGSSYYKDMDKRRVLDPQHSSIRMCAIGSTLEQGRLTLLCS